MINYHHIGGRNGTYPLPIKKGALLQNFHLVLYDADTNCLKQMEKANCGDWGKISIFPYCIGGETGKAKFNLNFHPTTNSLYPFNEDYADYGYISNPSYGEYVLGDACKYQKSIDLELFSLEDALKLANIASVDFLSLDVQGAEYDILKGAKNILKKNCVGIQLEAEFVKLYSGQKTYPDINILLENLGYELIDLESFGRCAPLSMPIGYRGLEQILSAEAIYIKKLDLIVENGDIEQIWKGAFFSLIYKKLGLCLKFLGKAISLENKESYNLDEMPLYKKLLLQLWKLYKNDRQYTFPRISQLFSNEGFQTYYCKGESPAFPENKTLSNQISNLALYVKSLQERDESSIEVLLKEYELYDVVETIKKNRFFETDAFFKLAKNFV